MIHCFTELECIVKNKGVKRDFPPSNIGGGP